MKRTLVMLAAVVALAAVPAQAEQADYKFKIFGGAAYVSPLSDSSVEGIANSVEASSEVGWEIGAEWKPFNRIGFELAYLDATHDVEADGVKVGEIGMSPLFLTANFHVINGKHIDWYVGPTVAYVDWGNIELEDGDTVPTDSETTYGISTGLDIGITKNFAIVGGLRWLDSSVESDDIDGSVSVDPLFARLGVAFRF